MRLPLQRYSLAVLCVATVISPVLGSGSVAQTLNVFANIATPFKILIGAGIGIVALAILFGAATVYAQCLVQHAATIDQSLTARYLSIPNVSASLIIAVVLLNALFLWRWTDYLGVPETHGNALFAWHPLLMAGGFLSAQALGMISFVRRWSSAHNHQSVVSTPLLSTIRPWTHWSMIAHGACHLLALTCLLLGLIVIVQYKVHIANTPSLSTMHSWIGILTVAWYVFTLLWGLWMRLLIHFQPLSILLRVFDLRKAHRVLGMFSLAFTVMSVLTGIMAYLPISTCYYTDAPVREADPANHYYLVDRGCRIAHGVGVIAMVLFVLVVVALQYRSRVGEGNHGISGYSHSNNSIITSKQSVDNANGEDLRFASENQMNSEYESDHRVIDLEMRQL